MTEPYRVYALCSHDPSTGCATTIVAVAGVDEERNVTVSWVPLEHIPAASWRARLRDTSMPLADTIEWWAEQANGISFDVLELPAPPAADLDGAVEGTMDDLLAQQSRT